MWCCISVDGGIVHICEVYNYSGHKSFRCAMLKLSGPEELLFVLFETANCT